MTILYFTGTGNSLHIAKEIGGNFSAKLLSIPQLIKRNEYYIEDDIIGIIYPIYYLDTPNIVDEYLNKVMLKSKYTFAILNHALFSFDTKCNINKYNFNVDYVVQLKAPDNYIPVFDMKKSVNKNYKYLSKIDEVVKDITSEKRNNTYNWFVYSFGNIIRKLNKPNAKLEDKKFYVSDKCTRCKVCTKVCPVNNIKVDNSVIFNNNCEQCLACIQTCPHNAIHHLKEKNSKRYVNKYVSINEIINANNRT